MGLEEVVVREGLAVVPAVAQEVAATTAAARAAVRLGNAPD